MALTKSMPFHARLALSRSVSVWRWIKPCQTSNTKLVNAQWIDGALSDDDRALQDDSITNVEVFDSETLVPVTKDRNVTAFMATFDLPKNPFEFRLHQGARFQAALQIWPEIEKLLVHFRTENWRLFDKQAEVIDIGETKFENQQERLMFVLRVFDLYGKVFRPGSDGNEQLVRQRVNLAESSSPKVVSEFVKSFSSAGKDSSLWGEIVGLRGRWPKFFPSLSGIFNIFYWDERTHTLDKFTLAEKRFEELKPFYVDCFETFCRLSVIAAAVECVIATGSCGVQSSKTVMPIEDFSVMPNGNKPAILNKTVVGPVFVPFIDSALRNGIGHHAARYEVTKDSVEYEIHNKKGTQRLQIPYVRFCEKVVKLYGQVELAAIYANWMKGRACGLTGRII